MRSPSTVKKSSPSPRSRREAGAHDAEGVQDGDRFPSLPVAETRMIRTIRSALLSLRAFMEPAYREFGLGDTSFHVLYFLCTTPGGAVSPSQLSTFIAISRANVTKVLDQLVADGWVTREAEVRDARRALIRVTPKGERIARQATLKAIDATQAAFAGLSPEEIEVMHLLLRKIVVGLGQLPRRD